MKKIYEILPKYAWVPIACSLILNGITYNVSRLFTRGMTHYDLSLALDGKIPFVPSAIVIYILSFAFWAMGFVVIGRESKSVCYRVFTGEQIAKFLCLVIFMVLPTCMARPEVPGSDIFSQLTRFIYWTDTPDNLLPSIHCLDSWVVFRGAMKCHKVGKGYKLGCFIFALMVFASTLLVKQHVIVDVFAGVAVVEIGLWLADRLKAWRIYDRKREIA